MRAEFAHGGEGGEFHGLVAGYSGKIVDAAEVEEGSENAQLAEDDINKLRQSPVGIGVARNGI